MDLIREHLIYKHVPLVIPIDALKTQEQYEIIRLLLACRKEDVCVLVSDKSNKYILELLKELKISTRETASVAAAGAS
jgi:hypothetical protein